MEARAECMISVCPQPAAVKTEPGGKSYTAKGKDGKGFKRDKKKGGKHGKGKGGKHGYYVGTRKGGKDKPKGKSGGKDDGRGKDNKGQPC